MSAFLTSIDKKIQNSSHTTYFRIKSNENDLILKKKSIRNDFEDKTITAKLNQTNLNLRTCLKTHY